MSRGRARLVVLVLAVAAAGTGASACAHGKDHAKSREAGVATAGDGAQPSLARKTELKVTIAEADVPALDRALGLEDPAPIVRKVTFFDTEGRALWRRGLVLRARRNAGSPKGEDEVTVKVIGAIPADAPGRFGHLDGYKLERDRSPYGARDALSLSVEGTGATIDRVAAGAPVTDLFSPAQRTLVELAGGAPWGELRAIGPVIARVWKKERVPGCSLALTLERWQLPDREIVELSTRVKLGDGDAAMAELQSFLRAHGVDPRGVDASKTRSTIEGIAPEP